MPPVGPGHGSDIKIPHVLGVLLDEFATRLRLTAHQHREEMIGLGTVVKSDLQQGPHFRVHRRLSELFGIHLSQSFIALHRHAGAGQLLEHPVFFLIAVNIVLALAVF